MDGYLDAVRRIVLATNQLDGVYYLFGKHFGINGNTLAFLYALSDGLPHSQKAISDEWLIPRTTINSTVKMLLAEGIVEFGTALHGKEKRVRMTEKGQAYVEPFLQEIHAAEVCALQDTLERYPDFVSALEDYCKCMCREFDLLSEKKQE